MEEIASMRIRTNQMKRSCREMYQKSYKSRNDIFTLTKEEWNGNQSVKWQVLWYAVLVNLL